jgi:hypothetical protein
MTIPERSEFTTFNPQRQEFEMNRPLVAALLLALAIDASIGLGIHKAFAQTQKPTDSQVSTTTKLEPAMWFRATCHGQSVLWIVGLSDDGKLDVRRFEKEHPISSDNAKKYAEAATSQAPGDSYDLCAK